MPRRLIIPARCALDNGRHCWRREPTLDGAVVQSAGGDLWVARVRGASWGRRGRALTSRGPPTTSLHIFREMLYWAQ